MLSSSYPLLCMCNVISQDTFGDSLSHTEPTVWFPLRIPFSLLLRESGFIYGHHNTSVCMSMSVCWSQSFCLGPQPLSQDLTKSWRKQIPASSYKFCENRQEGNSIIIFVKGKAGMCNPRDGSTPANSSTMGKVFTETHSQPLDTNL